MDDLVAFLNARLDEDEAVANGLFFACRGPGPLRFVPGYGGPAADAFIAHNDPARVLREVAAKRRLVGWHQPEWNDYVDGDGYDRTSLECQECESPGTPDNWPCRSIHAVAAVYSDHPDYRPDWKP